MQYQSLPRARQLDSWLLGPDSDVTVGPGAPRPGAGASARACGVGARVTGGHESLPAYDRRAVTVTVTVPNSGPCPSQSRPKFRFKFVSTPSEPSLPRLVTVTVEGLKHQFTISVPVRVDLMTVHPTSIRLKPWHQTQSPATASARASAGPAEHWQKSC